jgi:hypothetical protein
MPSFKKGGEMKTLRVKGIVSALAAIIISITGSNGFATTVNGPRNTDRFEKENKDIHQDLLRIRMHRDHIKFLKDKRRHDRRSGAKTLVVMDKKELTKTRADLHRDKCYVKADKRDLRSDYKMAIHDRKIMIREDRKRLADAKKMQRKENTEGYTTPTGDQVAVYQRDLDSDREALKELMSDRGENMLAVNKDIRQAKGEFFVFNYAESGMAGIGSWMRK